MQEVEEVELYGQVVGALATGQFGAAALEEVSVPAAQSTGPLRRRGDPKHLEEEGTVAQ